MKHLIPLMILLLMAGLVQAQSNSESNQPNEQSKVTREYDENGNLIRFDSSYVKSWSSDSALTTEEIEKLQQEMENMFNGRFGGDSATFMGEPFPGPADPFFQQFRQQAGDTTRRTMPGFQNSFPDMEELQQQMMQHFGQFFYNDSTQIQYGDSVPGQMPFDLFGNPDEFEKIRKEFEQHFEEFNKSLQKGHS